MAIPSRRDQLPPHDLFVVRPFGQLRLAVAGPKSHASAASHSWDKKLVDAAITSAT